LEDPAPTDPVPDFDAPDEPLLDGLLPELDEPDDPLDSPDTGELDPLSPADLPASALAPASALSPEPSDPAPSDPAPSALPLPLAEPAPTAPLLLSVR